MYNVNVIVRHDGLCSWLPPTKLKTSCNIDMHYFPFDTQSCDIKLGSWESLILILLKRLYANMHRCLSSSY